MNLKHNGLVIHNICDQKIDDKYGYGAMGALLTSDRRIGRGFVSGGLCRLTILGPYRQGVKLISLLPISILLLVH